MLVPALPVVGLNDALSRNECCSRICRRSKTSRYEDGMRMVVGQPTDELYLELGLVWIEQVGFESVVGKAWGRGRGTGSDGDGDRDCDRSDDGDGECK